MDLLQKESVPRVITEATVVMEFLIALCYSDKVIDNISTLTTLFLNQIANASSSTKLYANISLSWII